MKVSSLGIKKSLVLIPTFSLSNDLQFFWLLFPEPLAGSKPHRRGLPGHHSCTFLIQSSLSLLPVVSGGGWQKGESRRGKATLTLPVALFTRDSNVGSVPHGTSEDPFVPSPQRPLHKISFSVICNLGLHPAKQPSVLLPMLLSLLGPCWY